MPADAGFSGQGPQNPLTTEQLRIVRNQDTIANGPGGSGVDDPLYQNYRSGQVEDMSRRTEQERREQNIDLQQEAGHISRRHTNQRRNSEGRTPTPDALERYNPPAAQPVARVAPANSKLNRALSGVGKLHADDLEILAAVALFRVMTAAHQQPPA